MLDWMQSGRFKVFAGQHDWMEEFRLYHHKVVKLGDQHKIRVHLAAVWQVAEILPRLSPSAEDTEYGDRMKFKPWRPYLGKSTMVRALPPAQ